jgi:glycosyltransferase involved in cell wall biosynthesis
VATGQLFLQLTSRRERYAQRVVCFGIDRYVAVSNDVARRLRTSLSVPTSRIRVVRNGIQLAPFDRPARASLRAALTRGRDRPLVLTLARLDWQKGLPYLLQAAAMVPEAIFLLAGDGPERAALETQAQALNLNDRVVFLGFRDDIPDLLAACDMFVLPSLVEGFPLAVMEAAAAGKPVIATAIGGTEEAVLHGETGLLVPPADPTALAAAVRNLLADPALAGRLAAAGKARAQREFAAETMVRRVTEVYEEVLAAREGQDGVA